MPTKWNECELVSFKEIAPQTRLFTFKLLSDDVFSFKAGQFITFDLPVHEKRLYRWKSYSLANAPDNTNHLKVLKVASFYLKISLKRSVLFVREQALHPSEVCCGIFVSSP
jgi:NAD(P)H-flavin reductase